MESSKMDDKQLNVGLVCSGGIYDEVVKEVLNHQGIFSKEIDGSTSKRLKFPCVILVHPTDKAHRLANEHCESDDNVIVVGEEIPLDVILKALGGTLDDSSVDPLDPRVNKLEVELFTKIKEKFFSLNLPIVRKWFWPGFSKACCVLTHDIDWLYYSPWHLAVIKNKSIPQLMKLAYQSFIHRKNYGNNIKEIILKERKRNVSSSFFFLTKYEGYHEEFIQSLKMLQEEKFEIGLHGSLSSHKNADLLKKERRKLEEYADVNVKGVRQHELSFLTPLTWKYQEEAGFAYDLTFSHNDKFGFRSHVCFPYHPIDIIENKKLSLFEIATAFMDWTAFHRKMNYDESLEIITKLEGVVEEFNGCLVMNFHNTYQNRETFPAMEKLYSDILDDVKRRNYWVTMADECCSWWQMREGARAEIVTKNGLIKGKTSMYPLPVVIEKTEGDKMYAEIREAKFKVNLTKKY